jgi:hypothetical protein
MGEILMAVGYFVGTVMALVILFWQLAEAHIFAAFLQRNWVIVEESGGNPITVRGNLPPGYTIEDFDIKEHGKEIDIVNEDGTPGKEFVLDEDVKQEKWWWERRFALYLFKLPWHRVKKFPLVHERMIKNIGKEKDPAKWIEIDSKPETEWYLLFNPTHEFLVPDIELTKGYLANALLQVELVLVHPVIAAYERNGGFFREVGKRLSAGVNDALRGKDFKQTQGIPKDPESDLCRRLRDDANESVPALSGYRIRRVFFIKWDLIPEHQELVIQEERAEIEAKALKAKAEAENAEFDEAMKVAKREAPNATDSELLQMVVDMLNKKNIGRSNLTVYAESGSSMAISTPPPQPRRNKKKGDRP